MFIVWEVDEYGKEYVVTCESSEGEIMEVYRYFSCIIKVSILIFRCKYPYHLSISIILFK